MGAVVRLLLALPLALCAELARAGSVEELKSTLARLQGTADYSGTLTAELHHAFGSGADLHEQTGRVNVQLKDGAAGLALVYPREVVTRLDAESLAREQDRKAPAATIMGVASFTYQDARSMTGAAVALARLLERSTFVGENETGLNGARVRILHFSTGLSPDLDEKQRQYVKDHNGTLDVTLAADGVPLASHLQDSITGRAFLVVSFTLGTIQDCTYAKAGDRLVTTRRETQTTYAQGSDIQNGRVLLMLEAAR